ncbi:hypothetical protein [Haloglycomyces albus]|uniref:hypothetical protein n=1 Tax=Haloglycomyces albus TaxID=526067 RepID=UPI0012EB822B|nr:hypothetical protein [Haloglycomyces albus]
MPQLIGTVTWEGSRVDIVQHFGRQTLWVTVDGKLAALVHTSGTRLRPHNNWTILDEIQSWFMRLAATAQTNQVRVCPDIEPTTPAESSDHDREPTSPAGRDASPNPSVGRDVEAVQ